LVFNRVEKAAKFTQSELILIILSWTAFVGLIPFVVLRSLAHEWPQAIFDLLLGLLFALNGYYVYKMRKVEGPRLFFALTLVFSMLYGFYLKGIGQIPWSYPGLVAIFFAVRPNLAALFCTFCILFLGIFVYPHMDTFSFTTYIVSLFFTCLFVYVFANLTAQQKNELIKLSRRDALTGLRNRRAFDYKLEEYIGGVRKEYSTCLIVFDIDHFKKVNDRFGHQVGDQLLKELGAAVSSRIRKSDRLYRIGGEEFAIILTRSRIDNAIKVAEDIRKLVQQTRLVEESLVTISLGVASYREQESKLSWFERCDNALYLAKREGRNKVKVA